MCLCSFLPAAPSVVRRASANRTSAEAISRTIPHIRFARYTSISLSGQMQIKRNQKFRANQLEPKNISPATKVSNSEQTFSFVAFSMLRTREPFGCAGLKNFTCSEVVLCATGVRSITIEHQRSIQMRRIIILSLMGLSFFLLSATAWSDTLTLLDGTTISGVVVSRTATRVTFRDDQGVSRRYSTSQIQTLQLSSTGRMIRYNQNPQNSRNNGNYDAPNNGRFSRGDNQPEYLPAGTRLAVLTNEQIDSNTANTNQIYAGQVDQDVTDNAGEIIIPRGSPAELVIRTFSSGNDMTLDVQAITVNGRRYRISTAPLRQSGRNGLGMNKRTAEMVGGGALIGTIIGAVVGHGKGAAIGAAVGAAGGAGAEVLTKGKQVSIPAETVLTFSLNNSVTLAPDEQ